MGELNISILAIIPQYINVYQIIKLYILHRYIIFVSSSSIPFFKRGEKTIALTSLSIQKSERKQTGATKSQVGGERVGTLYIFVYNPKKLHNSPNSLIAQIFPISRTRGKTNYLVKRNASP